MRVVNSEGQEYLLNTVFVLMPFKLKSTWNVLQTCCDDLSLECNRVDLESGGGAIIDEIHKNIDDTEFLIFDLTDYNPNVMYELGYAIANENEQDDIIIIKSKIAHEEIPFNIRHRRIEMYENEEHLQEIVMRSLSSLKNRRKPYKIV